LQQIIVAKFHEEWKGRIDPWQPKRKQRKKAAKSTKNRTATVTGNNKGDAMSVPKVFYRTFQISKPIRFVLPSL
jgi:hypothetical protein